MIQNLNELNMTDSELDQLTIMLNDRHIHRRYEENVKSIKKNMQYDGKCYKSFNGHTYLRVLSAKSENEYRFECMIFKFPIELHESKDSSLRFRAANAFSNIEFEGVHIESVPLLCDSDMPHMTKVIDELVEISETEYFDKMDAYMSDLKQKIKSDFFKTDNHN